VRRMRRSPTDGELAEEVRAHLAMAVRDRVARGESPEEARLAALREFGNVTVVRETTRDMWGWRWLDVVRQDIRYAARGLGRSPGLAVTILVTLALGVGGVGAIFSVVDRIFFQVSPGVESARSVARIVFFRPRQGAEVRVTGGAGLPDLDDFRAATAGVASIEGYSLETNPPFTVGLGTDAPREMAFTTTGYFGLLGVSPALGRFYTADENRIGDPTPVIVLSYASWKARYGGDSSVLGRTLAIDSVPFRIIGIAQAGFEGLDVDATEMWAPYSALDAHFASMAGFSRMAGSVPLSLQHHGFGLTPIVRIGPGTDRRAIETALTTAYRRTATGDDAGDSAVTVHVTPLIEARGPHMVGVIDERHVGLVLTVAAVTLIALVICVANVASLLFLRALRRRHEIAVRLALGISRARLIGQLVTESVMLAALAGAISTLVAYWGGRLLRMSLLSAIHWPLTVVGYRGAIVVMGLSLAAGLVAGMVPGVFGSDPRIREALKTGTPGAGHSHPRLRGALIATQASMCVVLLVCCGVFVQSLHRALTLNLGFDADRIVDLATTIDPASAEPALLAARARLRAVPGVEGVSIASGESLRGGATFDMRLSNGDSLPDQLRRRLDRTAVDSTYFRTEGISLLRGRGIESADVATSLPVAVISEGMARTVWGAIGASASMPLGGVAPIGECFYVAHNGKGPVGPCVTVVGIARDVRSTITDPSTMRAYFPLTQPPIRYQMRAGRATYMGGVLAIHLSRPPVSAQLRAIRSIADSMPVGIFGPAQVLQPMVQLAPEVAPWRVGAILFSVFGAITLFLAGVGLYGLVGYDVTCRTRELGVRIALGARRVDVLRIVVGSGVRIAAIASVAGIMVAFASVRVIASLLFDTSPADPVVLGVVVLTLMAVAILASLIPAWRATRVDPIVALRNE
jgi:putative ABC transport system permease protein